MNVINDEDVSKVFETASQLVTTGIENPAEECDERG